MKMFKLFGALLCAGLILGLSTGRVFARITGTTGNAETCWGAGGVEFCIDTSGNLIPTTTAIGDLGLTGLRWKNLWLSGNATVGGTLTAAGATTLLVRTKSQLEAIVPAVGNAYQCSDCTLTYSICVATGTAAGQFRVSGTTAGCGTNN